MHTEGESRFVTEQQLIPRAQLLLSNEEGHNRIWEHPSPTTPRLGTPSAMILTAPVIIICTTTTTS